MRARFQAFLLLTLAAGLTVLGFAGFGLWPLALICVVPALLVLDPASPLSEERTPDAPKGPATDPRYRGLRSRLFSSGLRFFLRALFFGYLTVYGGFYWVVTTIVEFGGFPYALSLLFASVYFVYQALQFVLMLWLFRRARFRGWPATPSLVAAFVAAEFLFPQLFDFFYGASFHMLPPLIQVADLGGPLLLTALCMAVNGAAYELLSAWLRGGHLPWLPPAVAAGAVALCLAYGFYRIAEVDARAAAAPAFTVGIVQPHMPMSEKRADPMEGRRRHVEQSLELERTVHPDLLVWSESASNFVLPEGISIRRALYTNRYGQSISTPVLFGGISRRVKDGVATIHNTAFMADAEGHILATTDKNHLLAFGEFIPFGDWYPELYELSPHTSHFTPGERVSPLPFLDYRIATMICYEDILPGFVRRAVAELEPHLLVNLTNDSWFGPTQEPHVHLALSKLRAVEHHRYLVRSTNTGVSAIVDPVGRVPVAGPVFERATLHGQVRMMEGTSLYRYVGDWPGWLAALAIGVMGVFRRRPKAAPAEHPAA